MGDASNREAQTEAMPVDQESSNWETAFDEYHKRRGLEAESEYIAEVDQVIRVSSDLVLVVVVVQDVKWAIRLTFPEMDPDNLPPELFQHPSEVRNGAEIALTSAEGPQVGAERLADIATFACGILNAESASLSELPGARLSVTFGPEFQTIQLESIDHEFPVRQFDENGPGGQITDRDDAVAEIIGEYFGGWRGIRTSLAVDSLEQEDDRFQVAAPLTADYTAVWQFDITDIIPVANRDAVYRLIEKAGGGDPEFLAGQDVRILHTGERQLCLDDHMVVTAEEVNWSIVLPNDYDEWHEAYREARCEASRSALFRWLSGSQEGDQRLEQYFYFVNGVLGVYTLSLFIVGNTLSGVFAIPGIYSVLIALWLLLCGAWFWILYGLMMPRQTETPPV